ncbi:thioesterase family protein [Streptomyces thinghirensis]|nr:thioesterase family protein [Streptomyces thinghirensis]
MAAQALVAAGRTVPEDRHAHSLHAYFLRPGDPGAPIVYNVDRLRDGRSFTTRRVVAVQHGKPIFGLSASFQTYEEGLDHQAPMPPAPDPATLPHRRGTAAELPAPARRDRRTLRGGPRRRRPPLRRRPALRRLRHAPRAALPRSGSAPTASSRTTPSCMSSSPPTSPT